MNLINNSDENVRAIEVLIKALGTMVMEPEYATDPNTMTKRLVTTVQKPIFEGELRENLKIKLLEIVDQL